MRLYPRLSPLRFSPNGTYRLFCALLIHFQGCRLVAGLDELFQHSRSDISSNNMLGICLSDSCGSPVCAIPGRSVLWYKVSQRFWVSRFLRKLDILGRHPVVTVPSIFTSADNCATPSITASRLSSTRLLSSPSDHHECTHNDMDNSTWCEFLCYIANMRILPLPQNPQKWRRYPICQVEEEGSWLRCFKLTSSLDSFSSSGLVKLLGSLLLACPSLLWTPYQVISIPISIGLISSGSQFG